MPGKPPKSKPLSVADAEQLVRQAYAIREKAGKAFSRCRMLLDQASGVLPHGHQLDNSSGESLMFVDNFNPSTKKYAKTVIVDRFDVRRM